ncbi:MAG: hypothetical protein PWP16_1082 [Eubacteriaceae bacterium]|jgi:hypothetical protein|nr:hypothetical protein [Eubacteriaceae bacterium]MDK2905112.1 hypothetical protein [Eubacteriaceae bacterium]MDK2936212.1 hypothetical protein [Eubacteriaceae bacterium]MDK2962274.1 hypothetical protein [Eubacteriaceae bacterium]MDN5307719.1 hypothetical protein [Eubacteriaceae bacterium]
MNSSEKRTKKYVPVLVMFEESGRMTPLEIYWEDGRRFLIDRVLDMRPAVSRKAGGQGIRYLCRIKNQEVLLFYEEPKWFVEEKR